MRRLADRGLAVVLISHNMNDVLAGRRRHRGALPRPDGGPGQGQGRHATPRSSSSSPAAALVEEGWPASWSTDAARRGRGDPIADGPTRRPARREHSHEQHDPGDRRARRGPDPRRSPALGDAFRDYIARVRGGDVGSLPAILGLVVLLIVFSVLRPDTFTNRSTSPTCSSRAPPVIVIAMGLVFVLLLGEIDLSAGYTAGVAGAVLGVVATKHDWPWCVGVLACLATGAVIGLVIGLLVARVGIPSFVVTLAGVPRPAGHAAQDHRRGRHDPRSTSDTLLAIMAQEPAGLARLGDVRRR